MSVGVNRRQTLRTSPRPKADMAIPNPILADFLQQMPKFSTRHPSQPIFQVDASNHMQYRTDDGSHDKELGAQGALLLLVRVLRPLGALFGQLHAICIGGWGVGTQLENSFVSFVRACARCCCRVRSRTNFALGRCPFLSFPLFGPFLWKWCSLVPAPRAFGWYNVFPCPCAPSIWLIQCVPLSLPRTPREYRKKIGSEAVQGPNS